MTDPSVSVKPILIKRKPVEIIAEPREIDPRDLPKYKIYEPDGYRDGPEGFINWCEDKVYIPIYPPGSDAAVWWPMGDLPKTPNALTGRSYRYIWEQQKWVARDALRMYEGNFIYRLLVFCWMRGEGKSLIACLVQLWKFMEWTRQQIVLGANSKEQVTFVHFDIIKDIVLNSPELLNQIGVRNILEGNKLIRKKDKEGNISSVIRAISSFSGIVSNITGYTFSEIFDMKNPKFFTQLDGSIRNIPNALGVIDSTVSTKQHILYKLFKGYVDGTAKTTYFSYRFSKTANMTDYWNPNMTQRQLDDYESKFLPGDFGRYFKNTWGSGSQRVLTEEMVAAWNYYGCDNQVGNSTVLMALLKRKIELQEALVQKQLPNRPDNTEISVKEISEIDSRLMPIENIYKLKEGLQPTYATAADLDRLSELYDTDWAVLGGLDRADPMKADLDRGARTIFTCVAKGLPGSRSRPFQVAEGNALPYFYVLLYLIDIADHSIEDVKEAVTICNDEYDGIDMFCAERWGVQDMVSWCDEKTIPLEVMYPSYANQRAAFADLYLSVSRGLFKTPPLGVWGSKETDILVEESEVFLHDSDKRWFGSPEKHENNGIQDDAIFSLGWCLYGGRDFNITNFRSRNKKLWFGTFVVNPEFARR